MMNVSAAIILLDQDRVMICRRQSEGRHAGLWEFPGGKQEANETAEACLIRECQEELDVQVRIEKLLFRFIDDTGEKAIYFSFYLCTIASGEPVSLAHQAITGAFIDDLTQFSFCPADARVIGWFRAHPGLLSGAAAL